MDLFLKTAPNDLLSLSVENAKKFLNVDYSDSDTLISAFIASGRQSVENEGNFAIGEQTWLIYLDQFPPSGWIELPKPPVKSVTSIQYIDEAGTQQTWASSKYQFVRGGQERARVCPAYGEIYPNTQSGRMQAVCIEIVCGYKVGADTALGEVELPSPLLMAWEIATRDLFDNRGSELSKDATVAVKRFVSPYMSERFGLQ